MFGKRKIAALVAEFLGTGVLTLLFLSIQRSSIGVPFFIAAGAGLAVALMCFVVGKYSGGYFNPAITLALWTARKLSTVTSIVFILVQFAGAFAAFGIFTYFANQHQPSVGGHYAGRVLVAEAIGTGIFAFGLTATIVKAYDNATSALFVGLAYMIGIIAASGSSASLGLLNPALALGIKAGSLSYIVGPLLGAIIGVNLYGLIYADKWSLVIPSSVTAGSKSAAVSAPVAKKSSSKKKTSSKK